MNPSPFVGMTFGKLTVLSVGKTPETRKYDPFVSCRCKCGKEKDIRLSDLRRKDRGTRSCGCAIAERAKNVLSKIGIEAGKKTRFEASHGHCRGGKMSPTMMSWYGMIMRCTQPSNGAYSRYGGSGISVCDRWLKFENFLEDMGERPLGKMSIDRIDNTLGYFKENCRWASYKTQNNNRKKTMFGVVDGVTMPMSYWCSVANMPKQTFYSRLRRGVPLPEILAMAKERLSK